MGNGPRCLGSSGGGRVCRVTAVMIQSAADEPVGNSIVQSVLFGLPGLTIVGDRAGPTSVVPAGRSALTLADAGATNFHTRAGPRSRILAVVSTTLSVSNTLMSSSADCTWSAGWADAAGGSQVTSSESTGPSG